ncbi:MAG: response regulator [Paludibacter sp.]|nr:response regulator [Paludibacter sp.]
MNLTVKSKLIGGFSIILMLLIFISYFTINKLSESNQRLLNIVDVSSRKVNLSNELMIAVLDAARYEKDIILDKNPVKKDYYKDRIYRALDSIDKKTDELDGLVDEKGKIILKVFTDSWGSFKPELNKIIYLAIKNDEAAAFKISSEKGVEVRDAAIADLEKLVLKNETSMLNAKIQNEQNYNSALTLIIVLIIASILFVILISYWIIQSITNRISNIAKEADKIASREFANDKLEDTNQDELKPIIDALISVKESFRDITEKANTIAGGNYTVDIKTLSEKDTLGNALNKMTRSLLDTTQANEKHSWLTNGQNQLNTKLIGIKNVDELSGQIILFLCTYLKANLGTVYLFNDKNKTLELSGQYAFKSPDSIKQKFALKEGLIGQAASEKKQLSLTYIADDQVHILSSILDTKPKHLLITPFLFEGVLLGVIEIGRLTEFNEPEKEFIDNAMDIIAISINSATDRKQILELLEETQVQSEELLSQQEELRQMNEELEEQTQSLKQQQEELQMSNEELEEQTQSLEEKNTEVEAAKNDIEKKTKQLEISSKYKSEFLANMSHELRTPLNSLLILSKDLSENKKKNLDSIQVECAEIIYKSGCDLLVLINEVLDLSKIEAGKMSINIENVSLPVFGDNLIRNFKHSAEQKGLTLTCTLNNDLPEFIRTDSQRLNQILKNLLSNAIKFTDKGSIGITINKHSGSTIIISVTDTGLGIQADKQMAIFEAFQQADGGTSRKYGGTGLGLSISRELARLLGAEIIVASEINEGSTFSLIIPLEIFPEQEIAGLNSIEIPVLFKPKMDYNSNYLNYPALNDNRDTITREDKVLLIIEDDLIFASILLKQAEKKGFKCLSASTGEDGLMLALKYKPKAILLDLGLPGMNGNEVLLELKANPAIRHIPVHVISAKEPTLLPMNEGAIEYLMKPLDKNDLESAFDRIENFINRKIKNLLIIEDSENSRKAIRLLIGTGDVKCLEACNGKEALDVFRNHHIDCIILDLGLPDMTGFEFIHELEKTKNKKLPPIIVYTGKELSKEENEELQKYADSIIIKGVKSEERLLDETALFLHRTISNMPESNQLIITNLYDKETVFHAKKILVVDDDSRNIFALSKILQERGMEVLKAENGLIALELLNTYPDIDMVLMDIMMPEMDGYEAMRGIRAQPVFKKLPVIALTAKAMKDDKQKCIDAGANDYITKPIDVDRLLSLMRVWLSN